MRTKSKTPNDIDECIARFPENVQELLERVRETIHIASPRAEETISYGVPAFVREGILVYFAAFKNHIGLYPRASGIRKFAKELSAYKTAKGSVQFPIDQPIPYPLIARIVKFREKENLQEKKRTHRSLES